MGFNYHFHSLGDEKELKNLIDFLRKQDLSYPNYQDWVNKTEKEILSGYKIPILAFDDSKLVGEVIYQKHKELTDITEMKNLRVHPKCRKRGFAYFLIKQVEAENRNHKAIICDVRANENSMHLLLKFLGYEPILKTNLYDKNNLDTIFVKTFTEKTSSGIVHRVKSLLA